MSVGAALRRERAAEQPQGFLSATDIVGAAAQPFRDARPLLPQARALSGRCTMPGSYPACGWRTPTHCHTRPAP
ncbi:hypothetical protein EGJ09_17290 [Pseudomonas sp. p106]|nr:hypothetical protein EGJ09_17290 [Pseudomonas sp. p106]